MTDEILNQATTLKAQLTSFTAVKNQLASNGTRAKIAITLNNKEVVNEDSIKAVIGEDAYNDLVAALKTELTTQVNAAVTAKQQEYESLSTTA